MQAITDIDRIICDMVDGVVFHENCIPVHLVDGMYVLGLIDCFEISLYSNMWGMRLTPKGEERAANMIADWIDYGCCPTYHGRYLVSPAVSREEKNKAERKTQRAVPTKWHMLISQF